MFFLLVVAAKPLVTDYGQRCQILRKRSSPYGDLGMAYIGTWYAALLNLMAEHQPVAITVGTLAGAARVMYRPLDATYSKQAH